MTQRDSSGLPLRAMVMVLLFLGIVFLLVGFQAMRSGDDDDSSIGSSIVTTPSASPTTAAPAKVDVRVYNISSTEGAAETTATRLRDEGWKVTETGNLSLPDVAVTTVFFGETPGEREAAEEVGKLLQAPVAPRPTDVIDQPPGVIVAVTG